MVFVRRPPDTVLKSNFDDARRTASLRRAGGYSSAAPTTIYVVQLLPSLTTQATTMSHWVRGARPFSSFLLLVSSARWYAARQTCAAVFDLALNLAPVAVSSPGVGTRQRPVHSQIAVDRRC